MRIITSRLVGLSIWLLLMAVAASCQKPEQPNIVLTQSQWSTVQEYLLDEMPEPDHPIGARFGDQVELIGVDIDGEFRAGQEVELTWYWHARSDVQEDWKIFVHLDSQEERFRQNLDHFPLEERLDETYRTYHFKEGHILADTQRFELREDYPAGPAQFYVGFFRDNERAAITNDADTDGANRAAGPQIEVESSEAESSAATTVNQPTHALPELTRVVAGGLDLDGQLNEDLWHHLPTLRLNTIGNGPGAHQNAHIAVDNRRLIIGARMADRAIGADGSDGDDLSDDDTFVIALATGDDALFEIQVNASGAISTFQREPTSGDREPVEIDDLKAAVHVDGNAQDRESQDRFWSLELTVPLAALGVDEDEESQQWRANLYRYDAAGDGEQRIYAWTPVAADELFESDRFGTWTTGVAANGQAEGRHLTEQRIQELQRQVRDRVQAQTEEE